MNGKTKMFAGLALVLAVLSATFLATPALADANGTTNGYGDRLRTRDQDCDWDMLQTQNRDRTRIQNQDCDGECEGAQQRTRMHLRAENQDCGMNLEQHKHRHGQ